MIPTQFPNGLSAIDTEPFVQPEGVHYEDHGHYGILYTPRRPDYLSGNALLARAPVSPDNLDLWHTEWARAFHNKPTPSHFVLEWEEPLDSRSAFAASAPEMSVTRCITLKLRALTPLEAPPWPHRRFASDEDWAQLLDLTLGDEDGAPATEDFLRWQLGAYRKAVENGRAEWWGVWREGLLLGAAGLFRFPGGIRLEEVRTRSTHRGQGICTGLCHGLLERETRHAPRGEAWIVAAEHSSAERIYRRLGFQAHTRLWTLVSPGHLS